VAEPAQVIGIGANHALAALSQFPLERGQIRCLLHARRTARKPDVKKDDFSREAARTHHFSVERLQLELRRRLPFPAAELAVEDLAELGIVLDLPDVYSSNLMR